MFLANAWSTLKATDACSEPEPVHLESETDAIIEALSSGERISSPSNRIDWHRVVEVLGDGPNAADVFLAMCIAVHSSDLVDAAASLVRDLVDVAAAQEIVAALCSGIALPESFRRPCFDGFCTAAFREPGRRHYGTRAAALKGALYLAQERASFLRYLQGELLDVSVEDDAMFLRHVAAVTSLVVSHVTDPALLSLLERLVSVPDASGEAAFGLGSVALATSFGQRGRDQALRSLSDAKSWFDKVLVREATRADAALYSTAVEVLLEFDVEGSTAKLDQLCSRMQGLCGEYLMANATSDDRPSDLSWIGSRSSETAHWALLSAKVGQLASSLRQPAWLDAIRVIEEQLFFVLSASRTLFRRDAAGSIEAIVTPRIETSFLSEKAQLSILNQWLDTKADSDWRDEALRLREGIGRRLEATVTRNPTEAAAGETPVAALLDSESMPADAKEEASSLIDAATRRFDFATKNPVAHEILETLVRDLNKNSDFRNYRVAAEMFVAVLITTINFVIVCDNAQSGTYNDFVFEWKASPPLEHALHAAYVNALRVAGFTNLFSVEPQDVGGGRADVQFLWNGHAFVTECKRTFEQLDDRESVRSFGGQLVAYQNTSVTFSALLILDLFKRAGASQHLRERISVEFVAPPDSETVYAFVVLRVQGNRKSPSKIKLPKGAN